MCVCIYIYMYMYVYICMYVCMCVFYRIKKAKGRGFLGRIDLRDVWCRPSKDVAGPPGNIPAAPWPTERSAAWGLPSPEYARGDAARRGVRKPYEFTRVSHPPLKILVNSLGF